MSTPNINDEMKQAADYAIKVAKEKFGQILDYSENSLSDLDNLLEQAYQQFSKQGNNEMPSENALLRTANIWGSYLGEMIRKSWGGEWIIDENSKRLLLVNGVAFFPISYTYQRIIGQLRNSAKQYLDEIETKQPLQKTNSVQPSPESRNYLSSAKKSQVQTPNVPPKVTTINKNLIWVIGIVIGIIFLGVAYIALKSLLIPNSFKSNLNSFLQEGEKLNAMTGQGVSNIDYRNQLAQVKSTYSMIENEWPFLLVSDKALFDKAMTGWNLTLEYWDSTNNSYLGVVLDMDLINRRNDYLGSTTISASDKDFIGLLMSASSNYFEDGRADITAKVK